MRMPAHMQVGKNVCDVRAGMTENNFRPTILNGFLILKIKMLESFRSINKREICK